MQNLITLATDFIAAKGWDLAWVLLLFFAGRLLLKKLVHKITDNAKGDKSNKRKRAETLGTTIIHAGNITILIITILTILPIFGIDIRPILAGVGILGLAVGFGAQTLVKDFVSGLFILAENQYSIKDHVKIGGSEGAVEKITLRLTVLKDSQGQIIYIPNGSISNVINYSQK